MQCTPPFNNDNCDEHYDHKATNTDQIGGHDGCVTFNIEQLTKCFHTALPGFCDHIQSRITCLYRPTS